MRRLFQTIAMLLTVATAAGGAVAVGDNFDPPAVEAEGEWINWLIAAVFLAAFCVLAFKKSKRTHLD